MPQGVIIVGMQWGDEGKGKIVDYYSKSADLVVRYQGGNNAGHTLVVEGQQTILHLIPSGILHNHSTCLIGSGVVVDPAIFLEEIDLLKKAGVPDLQKRVAISDRAHLILNYHKEIDAAREGKGKKGVLGTTKRGIGPAYEDRASRRGLRIADLYEPKVFEEKLKANLAEKNFLLEQYYKTSPVDVTKTLEDYKDIGKKLKPYVKDVAQLLYEGIRDGKKVLYEGAQGVLLDLDYGTYPYVTSSHTLPLQSAIGSGTRIPKDTRFVGILKAYQTRVGTGPFPTELKGPEGEHLRESGSEFGATTGRPRRCGWLDLVSVRYACRVTGITHLALTKADVLTGLEEIPVCTGYEYQGKTLNTIPADTAILDKVTPVYETLKGWKEDLKTIQKPTDMPDNLARYIQFIEHATGAKISLVSTGAGREHVIDLEGGI